jgi:hypothetical protein
MMKTINIIFILFLTLSCSQFQVKDFYRSIASDERLTGSSYQYEYSPKGKTIAIGDVHADPESLLDALIAQKVLDEEGRFIGKDLDIVLLGDFADKGHNTRGVWDVINYIEKESARNNSRVHALFGNHDTVVLMGNLKRMREADLEKFKKFDEDPVMGVKKALVSEPYQSMMRRWKSMVKIGDSIFVHGGVNEWVYDTDPETLNKEVQAYVRAQQEHIRNEVLSKPSTAPEIPWHLKPWVFDSDDPFPNNPFWTRDMALGKMEMEKVKGVLDHLEAKRVVVGHTPTKSREIEQGYEGMIVKADTNNSRGFSNGKISALVIDKDDNIKAHNNLERGRHHRAFKKIFSGVMTCRDAISEFLH